MDNRVVAEQVAGEIIDELNRKAKIKPIEGQVFRVRLPDELHKGMAWAGDHWIKRELVKQAKKQRDKPIGNMFKNFRTMKASLYQQTPFNKKFATYEENEARRDIEWCNTLIAMARGEANIDGKGENSPFWIECVAYIMQYIKVRPWLSIKSDIDVHAEGIKASYSVFYTNPVSETSPSPDSSSGNWLRETMND